MKPRATGTLRSKLVRIVTAIMLSMTIVTLTCVA